tara:strand:+ start:823 stop:1497 length:675 start_codon:yes stop_codon:yes gene_type:complete
MNCSEELAKTGLTFFEDGLYSYTPTTDIEEERKQIQKEDPSTYKKWKNAQYNRCREFKTGLEKILNDPNIPQSTKELIKQSITSNDVIYHRKLAKELNQVKQENKKLEEAKQCRKDYEKAMYLDEIREEVRADTKRHWESTVNDLRETIRVLRSQINTRYMDNEENKNRPSRERYEELRDHNIDLTQKNQELKEQINELKSKTSGGIDANLISQIVMAVNATKK